MILQEGGHPETREIKINAPCSLAQLTQEKPVADLLQPHHVAFRNGKKIDPTSLIYDTDEVHFLLPVVLDVQEWRKNRIKNGPTGT